ncbi:MAG TPA: redoxin domain-containing protein, partial [Vicinamibacteria bacterium]|nr:redoxin domain-containing protein [Vicinamibacteria bacterium]
TRLTQPLVTLGGRLSAASRSGGSSPFPALLLGIACGLLWAPCAGPILGLVLTGAAVEGVSARTSVLLFTYAAGAASSLALALLAGGSVFRAMKASLHAGEWLRRALGAAVLAAVVAIALGLDTGFLTRVSSVGTTALEERLVARLRADAPAESATRLPIEGSLPPLDGAVQWLNSPPLTRAALEGKVVLVDFWTYSCINCLRTLPYVRAWADKYGRDGLVVIGVHTPEFAFEKDLGNVRKAVAGLGIRYPVAVDNDYSIWRAFSNRYWPAHYFVDAQGRIRYHHFGEGHYQESERVLQRLLAEAGGSRVSRDLVAVRGTGAEAATTSAEIGSPETYLGYARAERFVSPGGAAPDRAHTYSPGAPRLNEWGLSGEWTVGGEHAALDRRGGAIVYRFRARDLHLVLGPAPGARPVRFRVTIDGAAPGQDHGTDTDTAGAGVVTDQCLYQLVRQQGKLADRTFEIRFLDPGVEAFAFTFG